MITLLMYNISGVKAIGIKNICRDFGVAYREVLPGQYGVKLADLLGDESLMCEGEGFEDEMLYFAGFPDALLNVFLKLLRQRRCPVALKAVMTETNMSYTSTELYKEIAAEHWAMLGGKNQA